MGVNAVDNEMDKFAGSETPLPSNRLGFEGGTATDDLDNGKIVFKVGEVTFLSSELGLARGIVGDDLVVAVCAGDGGTCLVARAYSQTSGRE